GYFRHSRKWSEFRAKASMHGKANGNDIFARANRQHKSHGTASMPWKATVLTWATMGSSPSRRDTGGTGVVVGDGKASMAGGRQRPRRTPISWGGPRLSRSDCARRLSRTG